MKEKENENEKDKEKAKDKEKGEIKDKNKNTYQDTIQENVKFESSLFLNEKNKRWKKNLKWKAYAADLFNEDKISYTDSEITLIKNLLYSPLPNEYRRTYYLIASGAKRELLNNKNYYHNLLKTYPTTVTFPYEESINLDLNRTFPEDPYYQREEILEKMKNILTAFAKRNISIGYCQGFNYVVAKLLYFLNEEEEETFWVFTQILETYLPLDYYINFAGVRNDTEIVKKIWKFTIPNIEMGLELCITSLITKCFISLFSQTLNLKLLTTIWDAFFVYRNITLYKAFIWSIYLLYTKDLNNLPLEKLQFHLIDKLSNCTDTNSWNYFIMMYLRFNEEFIESNRNKMLKTEILEMEKKNAKELSLAEKKEFIKNQEKCNVNMPFCLCVKDGDFFVNSHLYNVISCRSKNIWIMDDYFFNKAKIESKEQEVKTSDDILLERQVHVCKEVIQIDS